MSRVFMIVLSVLVWTSGKSQGEQQIAQAEELTYFGLDFSKLKVIGESTTGKEIVNEFFIRWNAVVWNEQEKYDLENFFKKRKVHRDIAFISEQNAQRDPSDVIGYENQSISKDELVSHVKSYKMKGSGVGLVFIVENFNKLEEKGTMWVTFFDIESKQVLLAKNMSAEPQGFGFRNYWVRTVYEVMKESGRQYKRWIK